jgi:hypothetical protein
MDWIYKWSLAFVIPGLLLLGIALLLIQSKRRRKKLPPVEDDREAPE